MKKIKLEIELEEEVYNKLLEQQKKMLEANDSNKHYEKLDVMVEGIIKTFVETADQMKNVSEKMKKVVNVLNENGLDIEKMFDFGDNPFNAVDPKNDKNKKS